MTRLDSVQRTAPIGPAMEASSHLQEFSPITAEAWADLRREFMNWAEPVIADRIFDGYLSLNLDVERAHFLSGQHRRLWRAILLEHRGIMDTLWGELQADLEQAGMGMNVLQAIDQSVFEELLDIVLARFHSSRHKARGCSMILLGAASYIGASRAIAA